MHTHTFIHVCTYAYIHTYRMRYFYVLTKLDERDHSLFCTSNLFYTTSLQSQWLQIYTWMCNWVQKKKIKSVGEALEIKAQWRNKPRRGLCEGQWPECNACISCCVWDEAMSWLKNENSREKTPATCRGLGHGFIVIFIFCIFCRKARQRIGQ